MKKIVLLLICMLLAAQCVVAAEEKAEKRIGYLGVDIGQASINTGISAVTGTASIDEEDTSYRIVVGVDINEYVSVEGFYLNAGEAELKGNSGDTFAYGGTTYTLAADNVSVTLSGHSVGLAGLVGYPVHKLFNPYAKLGFHTWEVEVDGESTVSQSTIEETGTDFLFGAGVKSYLTDRFGVQAGFERYVFDGEDLDIVSGGLMVRF